MTFRMSLEVYGLVVDRHRTVAILSNDYKRIKKLTEKISEKFDGICHRIPFTEKPTSKEENKR